MYILNGITSRIIGPVKTISLEFFGENFVDLSPYTMYRLLFSTTTSGNSQQFR